MIDRVLYSLSGNYTFLCSMIACKEAYVLQFLFCYQMKRENSLFGMKLEQEKFCHEEIAFITIFYDLIKSCSS